MTEPDSLGDGGWGTFKALKLHALCSARATLRVLICIVEAVRRIVRARAGGVSVQTGCPFLGARLPPVYTRGLSSPSPPQWGTAD